MKPRYVSFRGDTPFSVDELGFAHTFVLDVPHHNKGDGRFSRTNTGKTDGTKVFAGRRPRTAGSSWMIVSSPSE